MPTLRPSLNSRQCCKDATAPGAIRRAASLLLPLLFTIGCSRFHQEHKEYVYVSAPQVYLHDRVAAVSNRVGLVTNGEALEVVERGKRFTKVRTPKGEVGWLEDHAIIDDKLYARFQDLDKKHADDPVEAVGQLRDDLYLHVLPGRETPHFLLIHGNTKVRLLERGTIAKAIPPGALPPQTAKAAPAGSAASDVDSKFAAPPIPLEDWWLVRDSSGHTGWLLAKLLDVDVPDEVGQYSEGQHMVAAYPIASVHDEGAGSERKSKEGKGGKKVPGKEPDSGSSTDAAKDDAQAAVEPVQKDFTEFVTVLSPPRGGLPYDFDQIRVFTWSLNHHRYETAYRLHGIQGYLPVKISHETVNGQSEPTFSFEIASGPNVSIDPETGVTRPVSARTLTFRMEGNIVKRAGADQAPIILTHDPVEAAKVAAAKKKRR